MTPDTRCTLCRSRLNTDSPYVSYTRNPETWRFGWMHNYCARNALEMQRGERPHDPQYEDRYDEYIQMDDPS